MSDPDSTRLTSYDRVATFYESASVVFSGGLIGAAKRDQLQFLNPGQTVLFIGCGTGRDVLAAARSGCQVTAVDNSSKMLGILKRRLNKENLKAKLICDVFQNLNSEPYDAVCANFFLNCFPHETMQQFVKDAIKHVKPNGSLMIADVAPPSGNWAARTLNRVYLHGGMLPFWLFGLVKWHPNHDYVETLSNLGWETRHCKNFRLAKFGPIVFRSLVVHCDSFEETTILR